MQEITKKFKEFRKGEMDKFYKKHPNLEWSPYHFIDIGLINSIKTPKQKVRYSKVGVEIVDGIMQMTAEEAKTILFDFVKIFNDIYKDKERTEYEYQIPMINGEGVYPSDMSYLIFEVFAKTYNGFIKLNLTEKEVKLLKETYKLAKSWDQIFFSTGTSYNENELYSIIDNIDAIKFRAKFDTAKEICELELYRDDEDVQDAISLHDELYREYLNNIQKGYKRGFVQFMDEKFNNPAFQNEMSKYFRR